jgi:hypothetical protein
MSRKIATKKKSDDDSYIEELEMYSAGNTYSNKKTIPSKNNKSVALSKKQQKQNSSKNNNRRRHSDDSDSSSDESSDESASPRRTIKKKKQTAQDTDDSDNSESDSDSESDRKPKKSFKELDPFSKSVIEWIKTDNKQKELREENKKLNAHKKSHTDIIIKYLVSREKSVVSTTDGSKLRVNKSNTKAPLKEEHIKAVLTKKLGNSKKAAEWTDTIYDSRPDTQRTTLKRLKAKKR